MRLVKLSLLYLMAVAAIASGCGSRTKTPEPGKAPGQGGVAYPPPSQIPPPSWTPSPGGSPKQNQAQTQTQNGGGTSGGSGGQGGTAHGDFFIALSGDCVLYRDSAKAYWIKPSLRVNWLGTTEFPPVSVAMTGSYMTQKATNPVSSPDTFGLPIGIQAAAAGRTITLTASVDPNNAFAEASENNNDAVISVTVPSALPSDSAEHTVSCHA